MSNGFPYVVILWLLSIVVLLWALHQSRRRALARREEQMQIASDLRDRRER